MPGRTQGKHCRAVHRSCFCPGTLCPLVYVDVVEGTMYLFRAKQRQSGQELIAVVVVLVLVAAIDEQTFRPAVPVGSVVAAIDEQTFRPAVPVGSVVAAIGVQTVHPDVPGVPGVLGVLVVPDVVPATFAWWFLRCRLPPLFLILFVSV